jgi:hypothetical protein
MWRTRALPHKPQDWMRTCTSVPTGGSGQQAIAAPESEVLMPLPVTSQVFPAASRQTTVTAECKRKRIDLRASARDRAAAEGFGRTALRNMRLTNSVIPRLAFVLNSVRTIDRNSPFGPNWGVSERSLV